MEGAESQVLQGFQRTLKGLLSPVVPGHFLTSPFSGLLHFVTSTHQFFLLTDTF